MATRGTFVRKPAVIRLLADNARPSSWSVSKVADVGTGGARSGSTSADGSSVMAGSYQGKCDDALTKRLSSNYSKIHPQNEDIEDDMSAMENSLPTKRDGQINEFIARSMSLNKGIFDGTADASNIIHAGVEEIDGRDLL